MNLELLKQINKDYNGKVISLLADFEHSGTELCFYERGTLPGSREIDDYVGDQVGCYVEYAKETNTPDFYSMLGVRGLDYEVEVWLYDGNHVDEVSDVEEYLNSKKLKYTWLPAGAMIQAIPELFMNITQHGERNNNYKGTYCQDLGIFWKVNGDKLELDVNALDGIIYQLEVSEDDLSPAEFTATVNRSPSRLRI